MKTLVFFLILHTILYSSAFQPSSTPGCPVATTNLDTCCVDYQEPLVGKTNPNISAKMNIADPPPGDVDIYAETFLSNPVRKKLCSGQNHVIRWAGNIVGNATTTWEGTSLRISWVLKNNYCWNSYAVYASPNSISSGRTSFPPFTSSNVWSTKTNVNANTVSGCKNGNFLFNHSTSLAPFSSTWRSSAACDSTFYVAVSLSVTNALNNNRKDLWLSPAGTLGTNTDDGDGTSTALQGCEGVCMSRTYEVKCTSQLKPCGDLAVQINGNILAMSLTMTNTWSLNNAYVYLDSANPTSLTINSIPNAYPSAVRAGSSILPGCTYASCPVAGCCPNSCRDCVEYELKRFEALSNGNTRISFKVTNRCKNGISYNAIGTQDLDLPLDLKVVSPVSGGTYKCSGSLCPASPYVYDVIYTSNTGNPGWPSVKFTPRTGGVDLSKGVWDILAIEVSNWDSRFKFRLATHIGGSFDSSYSGFSTSSCPPVPACTREAQPATLTSTSFRVSYDLSKVGACSALKCNSNFAWALRIKATAGSSSGVTAGTVDFGNAILPTSLSEGYYNSLPRCCVTTELALSCNTIDKCLKITEFKDDLGWSTTGVELAVPVCCPISQILNLIKILLPEGTSPYPGFTASNVMATCKSSNSKPCKMSMTWLTEGAGYNNYVGYYYLNSDMTDVDKNYFQYPQIQGYGPLWPDTSALGSEGCLSAGDTIQVINIPPGKTVGWFLRMDAAKQSSTPYLGNLNQKNIWYSYQAAGTAFWNRDNPSASTVDMLRHYGWINVDQLNGLMIFGVEDLEGLGDKDFNDVVFGIKLIGDWDVPGLLTYDPCTNTVDDCVEFNPYAYADQIYTPDCVPTIPLDTGVGTLNKECKGFYSIPDGWSIAMMDVSAKQAAIIFNDNWKTSCIVGLTTAGTDVSVSSRGYTVTGSECTATIITSPSKKKPGQFCYNLGCTGYLLLRRDTLDETCNSKNYGVYCDNKTGSSYYTSSLSADPTTTFINLYGGSSLNVPFSLTLRNRINVMVLMDVWNLAKPTDLISVVQTLPYFFTASPSIGTFKARAIGVGYNPDTTPLRNFLVAQQLSYNVDIIRNAVAPTVTSPATLDKTSNILQSIVTAISSIDWDDDVPVRSIYAVTRSGPLFSDLAKYNVSDTLKNNGVNVIIVAATSALKDTWSSFISTNKLVRIVAVAANYPDTSSCTNCADTQAAWISTAYDASKPYVGVMTVAEITDVGFATVPSPKTISGFGTTAMEDANFATNTATFTLPSNTASISMPYSVVFRLLETNRIFKAVVSWNVAPTLLAPSFNFAFKDSDASPFIINLVDNIRSVQLDLNVNKLDIEYKSLAYTGGSGNPWGGIAIYKGTDDGKDFALNTRFNSMGLKITPLTTESGRLTITYRLTDGCAESPIGTLVIDYTLSNSPPVAKDFEMTVAYGQSFDFTFKNYISDVKTAYEDLKVAVLTSYSSFGSLQTSSGTITYSSPSTAYKSLKFVPASNVFGSQVWTYRVTNLAGLSATATFKIIIPRGNTPPAISAVPTSLSTTPGTLGTWSVTITDTSDDKVTLWVEIPSNGIKFSYIATNPIFGVAPSSGGVPIKSASPSALLNNLALNSDGVVNVGMQWQPLLTHPYSVSHTFLLYAIDQAGASSNKVTINLAIPANQPPTWEGTDDNTSVEQYSNAFRIKVDGTDPNVADRPKLTITITKLPTLGSLSINGQAVVAYQQIPLTYSTSTADQTSYPFSYTPFRSYGDDSFSGYFTDPAGANSDIGTIPITIKHLESPPETIDTFATTKMNVPVTLTVTATDVDGNVDRLRITGFTLQSTTKTTITFGGKKIDVGQVIPLQGGKASWTFTYLTTDFRAAKDTFTYQAFDTADKESNNGTGTITVVQTPVPPAVWGDSFSTLEDTPLTIDFNFKDRDSDPSSPLGHYYNYDGPETSVFLTILSIPANGLLTTTTGATIVAGSTTLRTLKSVVWTPPPNSNDAVSFTFLATNQNSLNSSVATIQITVTPVDDPPTISLSPSSLLVDRQDSKSFTVTVNDIDTKTVNVFVTGLFVPFAYSTITTTGPLGKTYSSDSTFTNNLKVYTTLTSSGTFDISWSPLATAPDNTNGGLSVYASSGSPVVKSATPYPAGTFSVTPNKIPTIVDNPDYSKTVSEDSGSFLIILKGTDPDTWHQTSLKFQLLDGIPTEGVTLWNPNTNTQFTTATSNVPNAVGKVTETWVTIQVKLDPNYFGTKTFQFTVTDALGAVSVTQTVTIEVTPVNDPPTSQDYEITIPEDFCVLAPCSVDLTKNVVIAVSDVDDTQLSIVWGPTLPLPESEGFLVTYTNGKTGAVSPVTSDTSTISNTVSSLTFWFQPVPYKSSTGCQVGNTKTCSVFAKIPFTVFDPSGTPSPDRYYLSVRVTPVDHKPTTKDQNYIAVMDVPLAITLPGFDVDLDLTTLHIVTINKLSTSTLVDASNADVVDGAEYTVAATGTNLWPFSFTHTVPESAVETITYYVQDATGLPSEVKVTQIDVGRTPVKPLAWGSTYTTKEDTPISIPFIWGDRGAGSTNGNYFDGLYEQAKTEIQITALPETGTLVTSTGAPIAVNDLLSEAEVTWIPPADSTTSVTFKFKSYNLDKLFSEEATSTIQVIPVDDPPTISITPSSLVQDRQSPGTFTVTVNDIDSTSISVYIDQVVLSLTHATLKVQDGKTYDSNTAITSNTLLKTVTGIKDNFAPFTIVWEPLATAPDGTGGSFSVYGKSDGTETANKPSVTVAVTPNLQPFTIEPSTGYYTINVEENAIPFKLTLVAADPDPWHTTTLTYELVTLPPDGITVHLPDGAAYTTAPVTLTNSVADVTNKQTKADVEIRFTQYFHGSGSFTFRVIDGLSLASFERTVFINVQSVNQQPTSSDVKVIIYEYPCLQASDCPPTGQENVTITATDPDDTEFKLNFLALPELPVGQILLKNSGGVYEALSLTGPLSKPPSSWTFSFQPVALAHSTNCAINSQGDGCDAYFQTTFTVTDSSGLQSTPYKFTVIVIPVASPPSTIDVFATAITPNPVNIPIPSSDPDGDQKAIVITSLNFMHDGTSLKYKGETVELNGKEYPGTEWVFSYTHTDYHATTDTFTYYVVDETNKKSNVHTATVTVGRTLQTPEAWDQTYTTKEEEPITIELNYADNNASPKPEPQGNYFDRDGSKNATTIKILSIPSEGTFYTTEGTAVTVNSIHSTFKVTYTPPLDSVNDVKFTFSVTDQDNLVSNIATITIKVTAVNDPPTITLDPLSVTVDRTKTKFFNATVKDVDSQKIRIDLTDFTIPLKVSTLVVQDMNDNVIKTYDSNSVPSKGAAVVTLTYAKDAVGKEMSIRLGWTPQSNAPDGTRGLFSLQANDLDDGKSSIVSGAVEVSPNKPPKTIEDNTTPYSFTAKEDYWNKHTFTLRGTDPDKWHQTVLKVVILSLPDGVDLWISTKKKPLSAKDLPQVVPSKAGQDGASTVGDVVITPKKYWHGTSSFSFQVIDLLGAVSDIRPVNIVITATNHPPTSYNESLYIFEGTCLFQYCKNSDPNSVKNALLRGFDVDEPSNPVLTLTFPTLPDPNYGAVSLFASITDTSLSLLTSAPLKNTQTKWQFWYEPVPNKASRGCTPRDDATKCDPYVMIPFFVTDSGGLKSPIYYLTVYVIPKNTPPTSKDLSFTIDEDSELVVFWQNGPVKVKELPAFDLDNINSEITATSRLIPINNQGTWYTKHGKVVSATKEVPLPSRYLRYVPPKNAYSPTNVPIGRLVFRVEDIDGGLSDDYSVLVYVTPKPDKPVFIAPLHTTILEDSSVTITLNKRDKHWTSVDPGTATITVTPTGKGNYAECVPSPITGANLNCTGLERGKPHTLQPTGTVFFSPLPDENGDNYSTFTFCLSVTNEPKNVGKIENTICEIYTISVTPVNDPPILVPLWNPARGALVNQCDEDTYVRIKFNATDIDTPLAKLTAMTNNFLQPYVSAVYSCGGNSNTANCSDGQHIVSVEKVERTSPGHWEVSFIPAADWNGVLSMEFVVNDGFLSSKVQTAIIYVLPINDAPSIVKASTNVVLEYYEVSNDGFWSLKSINPHSILRIQDGNALEERKLQTSTGEDEEEEPQPDVATEDELSLNVPVTVTDPSGSTVNPDENKGLTLVNRLKTKVQDIDFFFGYNLTLQATLVNAQFALPLCNTSLYELCVFSGTREVFCNTNIPTLNPFLTGDGFPIIIDENVTEGYGVFILGDIGNVDKWDRELNSSFTITFFLPVTSAIVTAIPVVVIAALPVVAVGASTAVVGAWAAFGQHAADSVTGYLDAYSITAQGAGNANPLYTSGDAVVHSPLYVGQ